MLALIFDKDNHCIDLDNINIYAGAKVKLKAKINSTNNKDIHCKFINY